MSIAYWKDFYSIMCYGKIPERKEMMQKIEPTTLEKLEQRLQSMIEAFDQQKEEEQSDMLGYPHMQNFLLLSNALVAVHQAQAQASQANSLIHLDANVQYIMRQLDGFRQHGFPVEDIHR